MSQMVIKPIEIKLATGNEQISDRAKLEDFWKWAYSDCINNTNRGVLAEFIVGLALGLDLKKPREAWAKYDLEYKGIGIEVKSCSYHQVWAQEKLSSVQFIIPKTKAWETATNKLERESKRQADLYVLCLLAEKDRERVDPLKLNQWRFWIAPTSFFNSRKRSQHSIGYNSLIKEVGEPIGFEEIKTRVDKVLDEFPNEG